MTEHPITPPPELIYEWAEDRELLRDTLPLPEYIANCAAQWGADIELEACCKWLRSKDILEPAIDALRAARRPKPRTLKQRALKGLEVMIANGHLDGELAAAIREVLEASHD
jgi:hypothetical protein